jgi:TonB-dependent SusC/RagA subfamily outer membrane receptor
MQLSLLCLAAIVACARPHSAAPAPAPTPIFIIDGRIVDPKDFQVVAPEGVERMDVLKGDAAIRLYGPGAKNGVIVVTTKNPKP